MEIGRYVFNFGIITSALSSIAIIRQTKQMPKDWRRYLVWGSWATSFVLAVLSVRYADSDKEYIAERKEHAKEQAALQKAAKKAARAR